MHPEERTSAKALAPHTAGFAVLGGIPPGGFNELFMNPFLPFLIKLPRIGEVAVRTLGVEKRRIHKMSAGQNVTVRLESRTSAIKYMAMIISPDHSFCHHLL